MRIPRANAVLPLITAVAIAVPTAPAQAAGGTGGAVSCALTAKVSEHYGRTSVDSKPSCALSFTASVDPSVTSAANAALQDDGLKVSFTFKQPVLRSPRNIFFEDTLRLSFQWNDGTVVRHAQYIVSPYGRCKLVAPFLLLAAIESCSANIITHWTPKMKTWAGSVTVPYAQLQRFRAPEKVDLDVLRVYLSGGNVEQLLATAQITATRVRANIAADRYVAGGPDIGNPPDGTPRHRAVGNAYAPLSSSSLAASTFSDDAGPLLNIRNEAAKNTLADQHVKKFSCRTCGSFFSDDLQPFTQPITSPNVLGVDFGKLGIDRSPFDSAAISFPIDAGYKLITTADDAVALAAFNGNTGTSGVARDAVGVYQRSFLGNASALRFSVVHAAANRSMPARAKTAQYPSVTTAVRHTDDTLATVAYSFVPRLSRFAGTIPESAILDQSMLVRYGTQYGPLASTFTAAVSLQRDPPLLNLFSKKAEGGRLSGAMGYRNVGPNYVPADSRFDVYTGLHGWFGILEYKGSFASTNKPYDLKLSAYRMSDTLQARDASADIDVKYPLKSELLLEGSYGNSALTESQAARANKFLLSDAQRGTLFLPNGHYSAALTYTASDGAFRVSLGYARAQSQGCNKTVPLPAPPCYAFVSPSATGTVAWQPFTDVVFDASVKNASSDPFRTGGSDLFPEPSKDFYSTTSSHIEYAYALGANILKTRSGGCSTFLLTSTNRTGGIDIIANTPNQPRFVKSASIELVPGKYWPIALVGYSRIGFIDTTQAPQTMFVVRVQYGIQPRAYGEAIGRKC